MKLLLLGKNGQVGWQLQRALAPLGEVIALDSRDSVYCGDLNQPEKLCSTIQAIAPNVIINAAAYTAVDQAEVEPALAYRINYEAVRALAATAADLGSLLVHYSTDYVFDGSNEKPWQETDVSRPINVYGKSKLSGDEAIMATGCNYLILRTSWVYARRGHNFIKTIVKLIQEREQLKVIDDQIGAPTSAELIADVTAFALAQVLKDKEKCGLYHLAANGMTSWYEYAQFILERAKTSPLPIIVKAFQPISSLEYGAKAPRPLNSRLNTQKLCSTFALTLPAWQQGVERTIHEILEHYETA